MWPLSAGQVTNASECLACEMKQNISFSTHSSSHSQHPAFFNSGSFNNIVEDIFGFLEIVANVMEQERQG